jgi:lipopolysaccharide assembly LptE-like protein
MRLAKRFRPLAWCLLPAAFSACGYHVSGHASLLPKNIKTIAVPAFANVTVRYKLSDRLSRDITREFIARTRYTVVADPKDADAVLTGSVNNFGSFPSIYDPVTSRAAAVEAIVNVSFTMTDGKTGAVLFSRPGMEVRERYEISVDPKTYFDESGAALDRLSRDVARAVVTAVLEKF